jgi:uncharacterized protein YodC (DUF2158 family)
MEFARGDLAVLRSGGPEMTVRKVGKAAFGQQTIWCVWFDKARKVDASFDVEVLQKRSTVELAG